MSTIVSFRNVTIIYGNKPQSALLLVDQGKTRDEIRLMTGQVLGVANATLDIQEGEILVLMGLSGSGKSTLLRAVNGLAPVVRGDVIVQSANEAINPYRCNAKMLRNLRMHTVSMVFQQFGLLPWRTVESNVGFGLELAHIKDDERKKRVREQLELVNLTKWANHKINELSSGMQQRVGLARAFATGAPILLMDEPFSALDPLIRTRLQDELLHFQRRLKRTIVFVSHDLDEAFRIGNRIVIMEGGQIIQSGRPQDIVKHPANQYVADFVQHANPLAMLTARDVMRSCVPTERAGGICGYAKAETPLVDILETLAGRPGNIDVVDNEAVIGSISAQDVLLALNNHRRVK